MYDVIVVGGSAAGLTAAIYAARQELKTLVITKDVGGQMLMANEIQNFPGFLSISGFDLAKRFQEQAMLYGAQFVYEEVVGIERVEDCPGLCFRIKTTKEVYDALAVILAFGKTPKDLGVPGERELKGKGVSYCAICDGPLFKQKVVAIVGTGDQALDAANYLSNILANFRSGPPSQLLSVSHRHRKDQAFLGFVTLVLHSHPNQRHYIIVFKPSLLESFPIQFFFLCMVLKAEAPRISGDCRHPVLAST
ncbi:MAG: NAD(P)/FAD-dependent oxidoreductase [Thermoproteota archaeon]